MKRVLEVCLVTFATLTGIASSLAAPVPSSAAVESPFAGVWTGEINNLPGVRLTIEETDGKITGAVVFYFQERKDENHPWHVAGESPVPLLDPHVEGKALTFEVQHHRCHTCAELGPNAKFRLTLVGHKQARMEREGASEPAVELTRRTEPAAASVPPLQKGVSVELSPTRNALPVPEADQPGALIVSVTSQGRIYLGVDAVTVAALASTLKTDLANRTGSKVYLKADARTVYGNVARVLDALHSGGVTSLVLLTAQPVEAQPGVPAPPQGLEIQIGQPARFGTDAATVQVLPSGTQLPRLNVNNADVPWISLQSSLQAAMQNQTRKTVILSAVPALPFSWIVEVVDACRSMKARVVLADASEGQ